MARRSLFAMLFARKSPTKPTLPPSPPPPSPVTGDYVWRHWLSDTNLKLYARDYAGAEGEASLPIICLHGLTRNSADFEDVAPFLAATGRRVIVPDVRGRGLSAYDPLPSNYHLWTYAGDILKLVDELGISSAHFVGTSMGGLITMVIATLRPTLIKSAVLNDVGPYLQALALARIASYGSLQAGPYDRWDEAATFAKGLNGVAFPHYQLSDWLAFARRLFQQGDDGKIRLAYDNAIFDIYKTLPTPTPPFDMSVPYGALASGRKILLIRGAISALLSSSDADRMQAMSPDFTRVEIPGIGHAPMLTEPEARTAILDFLAAQD